MNLVFIVCALLTITASLFYRIHTTKSLKWKKEIPVVAITLSINFLGLLAALYLNRIEIRSQEKDSTVKLMKVAYASIAHQYYHLKDYTPQSNRNNYDVQTPELILSLVNSEIILRNISYETLSELSVVIGNLKKYARLCSSSKEHYSIIRDYFENYRLELKILGNMLRAEILYQSEVIPKYYLVQELNNQRCERLGGVKIVGTYSAYVENLMNNIESESIR